MELLQPTGTIPGPIAVVDYLTSPLRATHFATHGEAAVVQSQLRALGCEQAWCLNADRRGT